MTIGKLAKKGGGKQEICFVLLFLRKRLEKVVFQIKNRYFLLNWT